MATPRDPEGKFVATPPPGVLAQDDAKIIDGDHDDDAAGVATRLEDTPRGAIMKKQRESRAKEMGVEIEGDASGDKVDTNPADFKKPEEDAPAVAPAASVAEPEVEQAPGLELEDEKVYNFKVNGEIKPMTGKDIKKSMQIGMATEETLASAKETKRNAEAELVAARALRAVMPEAAAAPAERKPEPTAEETAKAALTTARAAKRTAHDAYTTAVRYGTDQEIEAAAAALATAEDKLDDARDAAMPKAPPPVDPNEALGRMYEERERVDTNKHQDEYLEKFAEDQKDDLFRAATALKMRKEMFSDLTKLASNEHDRAALVENLHKLSDRELGEHHFKARSRGLVRTLDKILIASGEQAREELKRRSAPATPAATPRQERESKKANTPTPPQAAAGRVPEPEPPKAKTSADIMAETRARRGK